MRRRKRVDGSGRLLKVDFFLWELLFGSKRAGGWLAVRESSRLLHIATISLRGTEMNRQPVSVCNETSESLSTGTSTRVGKHWNSRPCRYAHDILYKANAGGIPSESRKLG